MRELRHMVNGTKPEEGSRAVKLPTFLTFPGDFIIRIHYVKDKRLDEMNSAEWQWDRSYHGGVIRVPKHGRTQAQKLYLLFHELEHAIADWKDFYADELGFFNLLGKYKSKRPK